MNPQTHKTVQTIITVAVPVIKKVLVDRAAAKAARIEREAYEEMVNGNRAIAEKSEPIRVQCERLA